MENMLNGAVILSQLCENGHIKRRLSIDILPQEWMMTVDSYLARLLQGTNIKFIVSQRDDRSPIWF